MKYQVLNKILIVVLIGIVPILWTEKTLDPNISIQFIGLAIVLTLFWLTNKNNKNVRLEIDTAILLFILFLGYSLILLLISNNISNGIFQFFQFVALFLLTITFLQFENPEIVFKFLSRTVVILSLLILLPAYYKLIEILSEQKLIIPDITYTIKSVFPHRNIFSHFLILIFPLNVYSFFIEKKSWKYIGLITSNLTLFLVIIISNRTSWLAIIIFAIVALSALLLRKKVFISYGKNKLLFTSSIIITFLIAFIVLVKFADTSSLKSHTIKSLDFNEGSTKDRFELWERTILLIKEKPFFGHGLGSWRINMLKFGNKGLVSENNTTFYQRPHNDFLWIAAELGIIGFILYMGLFLTIIFQLLKTIHLCQNEKVFGQLIVYLIILTGFMVISVFSFPKERISHNIILFSSIGLFLNLKNKEFKTGHCKIITINGLIYISTLILIVIIIVGFMRYKGEIHTKNAINAKKKQDYQKCISEIEKAKSIIYRIDETSMPLSWYSGLSYYRLNEYQKANRSFKIAKRYNPYHIYVLNDYASSLVKMNKNNEAIENYKEALAISPHFLDAKLNLCALYFKQNNYYAAFDLLKKTIIINENQRLKKTVIIVIRKIIESELNKVQANTEFMNFYSKEYNNFSFYKSILTLANEPDFDIKKIINNPEKIKTIIQK